jgi:hypothetical protein
MAPRRHRSVLLAALLALLAPQSAAPAAPRQAAEPPGARAADPPPWLPRYDLDLDLRPDEQRVAVRQRVTWTNPASRPTSVVVFNVASRYAIPDKDVGFLAKMLEILRLAPSEALDFSGPACEIHDVQLMAGAQPQAAPFAFREDIPTALEVTLPHPVGPGESVTLDLSFTVRLLQRQGRWGTWRGVTTLAQWLPVAAVYGEHGWEPVPFIPWHQPFFNEAGVYDVRVTLPCGQKLASTGSVRAEQDLGDGRRCVTIGPVCARDFSLVCSDRFEEFSDTVGPVKVRCLAFPEHAYYARELVKTACEALPVYEKWFGPYPYPEFTYVESFFGWNGNECGGLVMIDQRVFCMPHLARAYVDYLGTHELGHQWWYNVVGTNGYAETWMDEGLVTYFSHRLHDHKLGKNNGLLAWPKGLRWLPQIHRNDYRHYGLMGTLARGEAGPTVQPLPDYGHIVNLFNLAYDRGSKVVGMIEAQLGEDALLDFLRCVYRKYSFRILRVADFRRELEAYTGRSWEEFFRQWVHGAGMCDWCLDDVKLEEATGDGRPGRGCRWWQRVFAKHCRGKPCKVTVLLREKGECREPAVLGFRLDRGEEYQLRIPIASGAGVVQIDDWAARVESAPDGCVRVEVTLPCVPEEIAVDPDQILLDCDFTNNHWPPRVRVRPTPLFTSLEETDLTNAFDRWNFIFGPWVYGAAYNDPWFTRSTMAGLRAAVYRTQEFSAGAYVAYRTDDRNIVAGVDALCDHWPWPRTQVGVTVERSLTMFGGGFLPSSRGVLYGRYVFMYGTSLYLPPFEYVEAFTGAQNRNLPVPDGPPEPDDFDQQTFVGLHYHKNLQTPYWDPEGGYLFDVTYQAGLPVLGAHRGSQQVVSQFSVVKGMPSWLGWLRDVPGLAWLMDTRWAARVYGAAAYPDDGRFFSLGGGQLFRGFDLQQRQGSLAWVASAEWRVPLIRGVEWDVCDHIAGARSLQAAFFYDVGDMYYRGESLGPVAHALGVGLRLDVAWFGMIERTMLRFDVAKTINADSPWQFWFGVQHPF